MSSHKDLFFFFVTDEHLLQKSCSFRITVHSFQSVSCCIIVGLMILVSSLTEPFHEVTLFVFGA